MKPSLIPVLAIVSLVGPFSYGAKKMDATELLSRIHKTNKSEIDLGQMAREKGQSEHVKLYGDQLVRDHTDADEQVEALAKDEGIKLRAPIASSAEEKAKMAKHDMAAKKLSELSGAKFDTEFAEAMKEGHDDAIKMLEAADVSDVQVKNLVQKLLPKLKEHDRMAAKVESELKVEKR